MEHLSPRIIGTMELHTFLTKYLCHILVIFEQNRLVRTTQYFEFFGEKQKTKHKSLRF